MNDPRHNRNQPRVKVAQRTTQLDLRLVVIGLLLVVGTAVVSAT